MVDPVGCPDQSWRVRAALRWLMHFHPSGGSSRTLGGGNWDPERKNKAGRTGSLHELRKKNQVEMGKNIMRRKKYEEMRGLEL